MIHNNNYFNMKIALVHDYIGEFGGAERVLLALSKIFPEAPIYTAFWRPGDAWNRLKHNDIRVSWAHYIPGFSTRLHSPLRFLTPWIWGSFDFHEFDVIISSASWYITKGFGRRVIRDMGEIGDIGGKKPIEICYCHTPPRWLYGYTTTKQGVLAKAYGIIIGFFMRQYDFRSAQRVDHFIANSKETASRIKKFYRRDSTVIYPPIEISKGDLLSTQGVPLRNYFLVVSRFAQPKNIDIAITATNKLRVPLKIVGSGPDEARLRSLAGPTIEFLGYVSDEDLPKLYAGAKAFLALSNDEDFGMTPLEAQAHGTPVIAYRGGGYVETVRDGETGIFFDEPTAGSLKGAIEKFNRSYMSHESHKTYMACITHAKKFSMERFQKEIQKFVRTHTRVIRS